jgi:hypothetical protein
MTPSLTCLIAVAIIMVSCARHADAQGTEARGEVELCAMSLPALHIEKALEPIVAEMCHRSPTFRRQLIRLVDAPGLVVTVAIRRVRISIHPIDPSDVKHDFDLFIEEMPPMREPTPSGALRPR